MRLPDFSMRRLYSAGRALMHGVLQLIYPGTCWVCGDPHALFGLLLCDRCMADITKDPYPTCPRCSSTVGPFVNLDKGCPACRNESFAFERALRMGPYDGLLREVVLRMKSPDGEGLAEVIGEAWACTVAVRLRSEKIDVVIPVPLHWWRRWQRGFNQSEVVARGLSRALGAPCRPDWLRCTRRIS